MPILVAPNKSNLARLITSTVALLVFCSPVFAHEGKPHDWQELWKSWAWEPVVLIALALSAMLYLIGVIRLWETTGRGHGIRLWETWSYAGGWLGLFIALVSPLHSWGQVLFSAHMTQHEVLMLVAAPLLVLGRPVVPFLHALPLVWSRKLGRWSRTAFWQNAWRILTIPFIAWLIHAIVLWTWHLPVLFQATLNNETIHALQHTSFLFSALLFWWALFRGRGHAMNYGLGVLYLFTTALHSGLLGVLLTFASHLWYPAYTNTTLSWGLTPIQDQRLGGLIMWIPAGIVYIIAALAMFAAWLSESERRVLQQEAR
jgi:cytochrome c oxidase assembly factor CtaG